MNVTYIKSAAAGPMLNFWIRNRGFTSVRASNFKSFTKNFQSNQVRILSTKMATPKIVIVTGGNNGIGYEAVKALLQSSKPYHVFLGSRSLEKGKVAMENLKKECPSVTNTVEVLEVDLNSDESIEKAFESVKASKGYIDCLVNNAGTRLSSPMIFDDVN